MKTFWQKVKSPRLYGVWCTSRSGGQVVHPPTFINPSG